MKIASTAHFSTKIVYLCSDIIAAPAPLRRQRSEANEKTMNIQPQLNYYDMGPGVVAFSTTRHGGYSKGNYGEFNINRYCGDDAADILRNRSLLCSLLDVADNRLVMPHQVHETRVAKVDEALLALSGPQRLTALEGVDAVMTDVGGVCIGVSTADCIPVLLYDRERRAACAIHAGWRGTVKRIVEQAVSAMAAAYGTQPRELTAQIGPGIHLDSFEVGDEVYVSFACAGFDMGAISRRYPSTDGIGEKWHIDLPACNRLQLLRAGVEPQRISVSPVCTFCQSADYFSARRLGINSGRIFTSIYMNAREG